MTETRLFMFVEREVQGLRVKDQVEISLEVLGRARDPAGILLQATQDLVARSNEHGRGH